MCNSRSADLRAQGDSSSECTKDSSAHDESALQSDAVNKIIGDGGVQHAPFSKTSGAGLPSRTPLGCGERFDRSRGRPENSRRHDMISRKQISKIQ